MSQARKTAFTLIALTFAVSSLTGCGISGPLYEVDDSKPTQVESQSDGQQN